MSKALLYTQEIDAGALASAFGGPALGGLELLRAGSLPELTHYIVSEPDLLCLIVQEPGPELASFLESLNRSFPLLPVLTLPQAPSAADLKRLSEQLATLPLAERRANPRFDWPLRAFLSLAEGNEGPYNLRALSATGAFLECPGPRPAAGSRGRLRALFQNFSLTTDCEILDPRWASSNLPDGFGVRFTGLDPSALALLDRIVRDALVRSLLEPDTPPGVPSLGGEELLPGGFELM